MIIGAGTAIGTGFGGLVRTLDQANVGSAITAELWKVPDGIRRLAEGIMAGAQLLTGLVKDEDPTPVAPTEVIQPRRPEAAPGDSSRVNP